MAKILGYVVAGGLLGALLGGFLLGFLEWYQDKTIPTGWGAIYTGAFAVWGSLLKATSQMTLASLGMASGGVLGVVIGVILAVRKGGGKAKARAKGNGGGKAKPKPAAARSRKGR